jgi:intracellular sulfur oxidation DsrE/DsrF family protein
MLPALATAYAAADNYPKAETGPVITSHGPTFAVPEGSFNLLPDETYRVVMDVGQGPDDPAALNRGIDSAARFLNMHARHGIDPGNIRMAVVLHGAATRAALSQESYQKRFGAANANASLIGALKEAGADIYLCGQSAAYNGFATGELLPDITLAVSAMTVHVRLQQEGYRAILF